MTFLRNEYHYRQIGLLVLRLGLGFMFIVHGWPKINGGTEMWEKIGGSMAIVGMDFGATFFGFMASFTEVVGGLFLMLGFLFRPTTLLLVFTMLMATLVHVSSGDGFGGYSHALESAIVFGSLFLIGPGRYSLDEKMFGNDRTIR